MVPLMKQLSISSNQNSKKKIRNRRKLSKKKLPHKMLIKKLTKKSTTKKSTKIWKNRGNLKSLERSKCLMNHRKWSRKSAKLILLHLRKTEACPQSI